MASQLNLAFFVWKIISSSVIFKKFYLRGKVFGPLSLPSSSKCFWLKQQKLAILKINKEFLHKNSVRCFHICAQIRTTFVRSFFHDWATLIHSSWRIVLINWHQRYERNNLDLENFIVALILHNSSIYGSKQLRTMANATKAFLKISRFSRFLPLQKQLVNVISSWWLVDVLEHSFDSKIQLISIYLQVQALGQGTLTAGGRFSVQLVSSLTRLDLTKK